MSKRHCFVANNERDDDETPRSSKRVALEDEDNKLDIRSIQFNEDYSSDQQATSSPQDFVERAAFLQDMEPDLTLGDMIQRKKPRPMAGFIDYTQTKYYDRYKQQEYTRRNDYMKYCHVCRKKTIGKLRVLPGDLRMRKVWILRSDLDEERSAELWLKELACEGSHGGEFCEAHFPEGSKNLKGNQLFPVDNRSGEGKHSVLEDIEFNFDSILLQCVFCGREGHLSSMLPFIRNRSKRAKWIATLAEGNVDSKRRLQQSLRGGVTQFLCDWHISDSSFEINGFGEWRLLRNALPDPHLTEADKRGVRIYLVDKCRDALFWDRQMWRGADRMSRMTNGEVPDPDEDELLAIGGVENVEEHGQGYLTSEIAQNESVHQLDDILAKTNMSKLEPGSILDSFQDHEIMVEDGVIVDKDMAGPSNSAIRVSNNDQDVEYSDDSDEENDLLEKLGEIPYSERLCQVCSRIEPIGNQFPFKAELRTWPFDEFRHRKWLEIMDWPQEFEESMKTLWQKRRTEGNLTESYHYCPINVCQSHLDFRELPERMEEWLRSFCLLCDSCMSSESLVVPFPTDAQKRRKWVDCLFPASKPAKFHLKKVQWVRRRLLRPKATRYRLCVYHFSRKSFVVNENGEIVLDPEAYPLSMEEDDFDVTPRGPNSVCKCLLCDDWKKQTDMVELRCPLMESEKTFLVDNLLHTDKATIRKTVSSLCRMGKSALICSVHFPENADPFSIIAERRILYGSTAECVLCSHTEEVTSMIPFPLSNDRVRTKWINSMCREPWVFRYLTSRLDKEGRHYLCASHFSRNTLRFQQGIGLWRKSGSAPLLSCTSEEERQVVWDLSKSNPEYHPLILEKIDQRGVLPIEYDQVVDILGIARMQEIENELQTIVQPELKYRMMEISSSMMKKQQLISEQAEDEEEEVNDEQLYEDEIVANEIICNVDGEEVEECIVYDDIHSLDDIDQDIQVDD